MKSKRLTINDLAVMTKHGFDDMQSRFVTKDDFKVLIDEIRLMRADMHDMKINMQSIVGLVGNHEHEIMTIKRHVGMTK